MTTEQRSKLLAVDAQGNLRYKALLDAGIVLRCEAVFCYGSGTVPDPQDVDKLAPCPECHGSGYVLCDEAVLPGGFLDLGYSTNTSAQIRVRWRWESRPSPFYEAKYGPYREEDESRIDAILSVLEQAGEARVLDE